MYQGRSRRWGALMLTVSICLRLCMLLGLDTRAAALVSEIVTGRSFAQWMLFLETGQAASVEQPLSQPQTVVIHYLQPQSVSAAKTRVPIEVSTIDLPQTLASAEEITVSGSCTYSYDKTALLQQPSAMELSQEGPLVLIVHTHSSEAYTPEPGQEYTATAAYRTREEAQSVIAVGDILAKTLEEQGISVLHDRTCNDDPSYNTAYWTTLQKIQAWKQQYPSIQMVLDIHRDAVEDAAGQAVALSSSQQGQTAAKLMLVVGTDQGGLEHPDWQENLANAMKLQSVLQGQYPGLCRSLDLRKERFNQHMTPGSMLIEVGSNGNTLNQALYSAQLLGDALARMLHALQNYGGCLQPDA